MDGDELGAVVVELPDVGRLRGLPQVILAQTLSGVETEYGFLVEGRGPTDQVSDSAECVRSWPGLFFAGWNYGFEFPRNDLRGFQLQHLAVDPEDWKFENASSPRQSDAAVRSDRLLTTGARFYNDHGHPEFCTPECFSLDDLVAHDVHGQKVVWEAAAAYAAASGRKVHVYKNNSDFHGASYGTHESYLVPRSCGFESLFQTVAPILVARTLLVGAGKVGSESGDPVDFQISQRADFFMEEANAETLYRRPIFNTRDEPHADPRDWIRLHVIAGDANMNPLATKLKVGLVRLATRLAMGGCRPPAAPANLVVTMRELSRSLDAEGWPVGRSVTWAQTALEWLCESATHELELDSEDHEVVDLCRAGIRLLTHRDATITKQCDWAAKRWLIQQHHVEEGGAWSDPAAKSLDLAYCDLDPEAGLYPALAEMEVTTPWPLPAEQAPPTRARVRGMLVERFREAIVDLTWSTATVRLSGEIYELSLDPRLVPPAALRECTDLGEFLRLVSAQ